MAAAAASAAMTAPGPQGPLEGTFLDAGKGAPVVLIIPGIGPDRSRRQQSDGRDGRSLSPARRSTRREGRVERPDRQARHVRKQGGRRRCEQGHDRRTMRPTRTIGSRRSASRPAQSAYGCSGIAKARWSHWRPPSSPTESAALSSSPARAASSATSSATQLRANPANAPVLDLGHDRARLARKGSACRRERMHPALQKLFAPQVQDFLIDMFRQDPREARGTRSRCPC